MQQQRQRQTAAAEKIVGVYGGNAVPGTYLKTRTGATRGEELFSRPDIERPWRTMAAQKHASEVASKEHEIEQLMLLCCNLRTELGNAKNDARTLEYAITEKSRLSLSAKDTAIAELKETVRRLQEEAKESKDSFEHQIRLLKSQHENDLTTCKRETQNLSQQQLELVQTYQTHIEDVRSACAREIEYADSRRKVNVEELLSDTRRVRENAAAEKQHYATQLEEMKKTIARIETDFTERLRVSEQRVSDVHRAHVKELETERAANDAALRAGRITTETLAAVLAERDEVVERYKQWNQYVACILNKHFKLLSSRCAHLSLPPLTEAMKETAALYHPRIILEDFESKATAERIVHRLVLLNACELAAQAQRSFGVEDHPSSVHVSHSSVAQLVDRQSRLTQSLNEVEDELAHANSAMQNCISRLNFFTDNLEMFVHSSSHNIPSPPLCHSVKGASRRGPSTVGSLIFVCCAVPSAALLWDADAETMRQSLALLYGVLRLKQKEYGSYECYSDDACMLLAFSDPVAACRFCVESQKWLLRIPWPEALLQCAGCREERDPSSSSQQVLFRGLRVAMVAHTGEACAEPTAVPLSSGVYSTHFYGKAVSQITHLCSMIDGGQVVVSYPVWTLCMHQQNKMGEVRATELGAHKAVFLNTETWTQDTEQMGLVQLDALDLQNRTFAPLTASQSAASLAAAMPSLSGLSRSLTTTTAAALERRREGIAEMTVLLRREYNIIQKELAMLISRASKTKTELHTLSVPQMIEQITGLFSLIEKSTLRAEELRDDLRTVEDAQMHINLQVQSFFQYFQYYTRARKNDDATQAQMEALGQRLKCALNKNGQTN